MFLSISSHKPHFSSGWISLCVFAHSRTHTKWPNIALCFSSPQGQMALAFFFFFSFPLACPTCLASLLIKRSQTTLMLWSFLNKWKSCFEDFWNKLINELWQDVCAGTQRLSCAPNKFRSWGKSHIIRFCSFWCNLGWEGSKCRCSLSS